MPAVPAASRRRHVLFKLAGHWHTGELQVWHRDGRGQWLGLVRYRTGAPVFSSLYVMLAATAIRDADQCHTCPAAERRFVVEVVPDQATANLAQEALLAGGGDHARSAS